MKNNFIGIGITGLVQNTVLQSTRMNMNVDMPWDLLITASLPLLTG